MKTVLWLSVASLLLSSLTMELHSLQVQPRHRTSESDDVRLVVGTSNCSGILEMKHQGQWRPADGLWSVWNQESLSVVCRQLDCGSAVTTERSYGATPQPVWLVISSCVGDETSLKECVSMISDTSSATLELFCSDLLFKPSITFFPSKNGASRDQQQGLLVFEGSNFTIGCSIQPQYPGGSFYLTFTGSNTTHNHTQPAVSHSANFWFPAADHTHQGNYSCVYHIHAFKHFFSSQSKFLSLTVTAPDGFRLVGGTSHCTGRLELKQLGNWRLVADLTSVWDLKSSSVVCRLLDCGFAVSTERSFGSTLQPAWWITSSSSSLLGGCGTVQSVSSSDRLEVICSGPLFKPSITAFPSLNGVSDSWTNDQKDRCFLLERLLKPKTKRVLQLQQTPHITGPVTENDVKLVGGTSHCTGRLEIKHWGRWKPVDGYWSVWNQELLSIVCRKLDCGSAVSAERSYGSKAEPVWLIASSCVGSESSLSQCVTMQSDSSSSTLEVFCSDLLFKPSITIFPSINGVSVGQQQGLHAFEGSSFTISCSIQPQYPGGSFHLTFTGSNTTHNHTRPAVSHTANFLFNATDSQQGNYSCVYHINVFKHNFSSESEFLSLTVSEPDDVRLVGGTSQCIGRLEIKHLGKWKPVADFTSVWNLMSSSVVCRLLDCGSAVSTEWRSGTTRQPVWWITSSCVGSESSMRECGTVRSVSSWDRLEVICSGLLFKPNITVLPSINGVSEGQLQVWEGPRFTISCSIQPQYPGGSFHLTFTGSNTTHNRTQPAVSHSANFKFSAADQTHQGNYSCVYRINVFNHSFSSESEFLSVNVTALFSPCGRPQRLPTEPGEITKIIGGKQSLPGNHPWQASLQHRSNGTSHPFQHKCGGVLIASCWVLTAAHCILDGKDMQVVLGGVDIMSAEDDDQVIHVLRAIVHPDYRRSFNGRRLVSVHNDVALLQLDFTDRPFCAKETRYVKTACLPNQLFPDDRKCVISGWGITDASGGQVSYKLMDANVLLKSKKFCMNPKIYGERLDDTMICAGNVMVDACQGDSGGPLMCEQNGIHYIAGVVSWGEGCPIVTKPGVYANVHKFVDWINKTMSNDDQEDDYDY